MKAFKQLPRNMEPCHRCGGRGSRGVPPICEMCFTAPQSLTLEYWLQRYIQTAEAVGTTYRIYDNGISDKARIDLYSLEDYMVATIEENYIYLVRKVK